MARELEGREFEEIENLKQIILTFRIKPCAKQNIHFLATILFLESILKVLLKITVK